MNAVNYSILALCGLTLVGSCSKLEQAAPTVGKNQQEDQTVREDGRAVDEPVPASPAMDKSEAMPPAPPAGAAAMGGNAGIAMDGELAAMPKEGMVGGKFHAEKKDKAADAGPEAPAVRAWFPESFLWQPLVQTDAKDGMAKVQFTVPDTLTTWRILALGQTRQGSQGGAVQTFLSTLPAYVDVAAPLKLRVGDVVEMPIQVVNQTADALKSALVVTVTGGAGQGGGAVNVAPWGSSASTVHTTANHAGKLEIAATLGSGAEAIDSVRKSVTVTPVGRPITQSRAGSLAGARTVSFDAVGDSVDGSVSVTVFPGELSLLRSEVDLAGNRGGDVASAAYAFRVSLEAGVLVADNEVPADSARNLGLVALQRLIRDTRSAGSDPAGVATAALALAGLGATEDPAGLDAHLAERMRDVVLQAQQPDGLWSLGSGVGLDDQLVASARCLWALQGTESKTGDEPARIKGARLRYTGALERYADRLTDPYVAAWALASGGADGLDAELGAKLAKTVTDALVTNPDGSLRLDPTLGGTSARTLGSSTAEATAVAILGLSRAKGNPGPVADLATGILGRWSPEAGFGGGWAGLTALPALASAMGGDIPDSVKIALFADGKPIGEGALDPKQKHAPVVLNVPGAAHELRVEATPAVPGLAFTAVATSWVPWTASAPHGLDLHVTAPQNPRLGVKTTLRVDIAGPTGETADIDIALPAGVDMGDAAALTAALAANSGTGTATTEEGAVHLKGVTLQNGLWSASLPVTPTLSGSLQSGASIVTLRDGETYAALPSTWAVR